MGKEDLIMPMSDLNDRAEGWGHTAGSSNMKDDSDWDTLEADPTAGSDSTSTRLAFSVDTIDADSREYGKPDQSGDLFDRDSGYGHSAGDPDDSMSADLADNSSALAFTGSNSALTTSSTEAAASNRTADVPTEDERKAASIQDRTSGYGHTAGRSGTHD